MSFFWQNPIGGNDHPIANACEAEFDPDKPLFLMQFGAYATTQLYVWADHLEDAFEEAVEWLDDNAPGHLVDLTEKDLREAAEDLGVAWQPHWPDWGDPEFTKIVENAEADLTSIGHTTLKHGQYVLSYEWWGGEVTDSATREAVYDRSLEECGA